MKTIGYFKVASDESITPFTADGYEIRCPYQEVMYDEFGHRQYEHCGSWCPHFGDLEVKGQCCVVHISCGGGTGAFKAGRVVKA